MSSESMSFGFDLSSYDDVRANAEAIYQRLAAGSMPCDSRWPAKDVQGAEMSPRVRALARRFKVDA